MNRFAIRLTALIVAAALAHFVAVAQVPKTYRVVPTYGHVTFTITKWVVFKEEGSFKDVRGSIVFDRKNPAASRVEITVQTATLDTNNRSRDDTVRSEDFLHVSKHPTMTFASTHVVPRGADSFDVTGDLIIRGGTRRITVPVKFLGLNQVKDFGEIIGFETTFTVDRTDFGVLGTRWSGSQAILGKEVTIHMRIGGLDERAMSR